MNIAVVVPTKEPFVNLESFKQAWYPVFRRHPVTLYSVLDGDEVEIQLITGPLWACSYIPIEPKVRELFNNRNDAIRNAGFYQAVKDGADIIITLDDDVRPDSGNDPIQEHIDALAGSYPTSWFNPFEGAFMRGFPYGVRAESSAVVSHGIWTGVQDFDAPTMLVRRTTPARNMYRGAIPKGCLMPISGMNLAFRRGVAPLVYFAPMAADTGYNRFADIWMGIHLKRELDERGMALVHGFSTVRHERQSNAFDNLIAEAEGIRENEFYWNGMRDGKYEAEYSKKRELWRKLIEVIL